MRSQRGEVSPSLEKSRHISKARSEQRRRRELAARCGAKKDLSNDDQEDVKSSGHSVLPVVGLVALSNFHHIQVLMTFYYLTSFSPQPSQIRPER
jgi:hypothetical protein